MFVNPVFKPSLLSLIVSSYLLAPGLVMAADCPADTQCDTVIKADGNAAYSGHDLVVSTGNGLQYQGGDKFTSSLYLKKNIRVSGDDAAGIYVAGDALFSGNLNIEAGSAIISDKGTAIKIDGNFEQGNPLNPNKGIYIKDGSVIQGAVDAVDFSGSASSLRIDVNGTLKGNIIGNGVAGNKINFGYQGGAGKTARFEGLRISGIGKLENYGKLTLVAQDKTIVWDSNFYNKKNASMIFNVGENAKLTQPILLITGNSNFDSNSAVKFSYTGTDINDIIGQNIVLLESAGELNGGDNVTVSTDDVLVQSASPLLQVQDSWLVQTPPEFNGGVSGNQLIARYGVNYRGADDFVAQAAAGGATVNEIAMANYVVNYALNTHGQTGSAESGQLMALLALSGTDAAKTAALADELTPDAEGSEIRAALIMVDKMRSQVDERTNVLRSQSYLGTAHSGWNGWTELIGGYGKQSDSADIHGYSLSTYGINVGFDRVFDKQRLLGISMAYARSSSDITDTGNSKTVNSFETLIYSGWFNDRYFIDGNINIGRNSNSSSREIGASVGYQGNTEAKADYDSLQLGFQAMAGMTFDLYMVKFEPRIAYNHQWLRTDDYAETGSPASLRFHRQSYETQQLGAGYNVYNTYQLDAGQFTPSFSAMAYRDLNSDEVVRETVGLIMDSPQKQFTVTGDQIGGDILEIKLNGHLKMDNNFSVSAGLSFYQRDAYDELNLGITTTKRF